MPAGTQPAAQEPATAAPAAQEPAAAAPAATSAAPGASGLSADDLEQAKGAELALGGASKTQATTAPAVASAAAPAAAPAAALATTPAEKKAAREIDAEIDDLIRALRKVDSIAAPAYVKYIRDRLDQTFGASAPAAAAPAATTAKKKQSAKKPQMKVQKGGSEPISIGGQKLNPNNPEDAKLIARARAAAE
jgi:hypothetical protein